MKKMKLFLIALTLTGFTAAHADEFSDRQRAAAAAANARYRAEMQNINRNISPLSRQLADQLAAIHGGVTNFNIRVRRDFNDSNVYADVRFSTADGLACSMVTVLSYQAWDNRPGAANRAGHHGCECYDSQRRQLFLGQDGSVYY